MIISYTWLVLPQGGCHILLHLFAPLLFNTTFKRKQGVAAMAKEVEQVVEEEEETRQLRVQI